MPKIFITGIVFFLLLGAGYGISQAARYIPWDCADWQAFAHDDRTTAILESLAENRGKTLYCGVDQSAAFGKAETWAAGKDRNERDDTVYFGERGQFRGFIAAQEGWLTEGESGITGQSEATIFEFPKEPPRRARRVKRFAVGTDPEQFPINAEASCGQVGGLICTEYGDFHPAYTGDANNSRRLARRTYGNDSRTTDWEVHWRTGIRLFRIHSTTSPAGGMFRTEAQWQAIAADAARSACGARGARYVAGSADFGEGHNENRGAGVSYHGANLGWFYMAQVNPLAPLSNTYSRKARESRTWSATCEKKGPRRDR